MRKMVKSVSRTLFKAVTNCLCSCSLHEIVVLRLFVLGVVVGSAAVCVRVSILGLG